MTTGTVGPRPGAEAMRRASGLLLGADPLQRFRVGRTLLASSVYLAALGAEGLRLEFGLGDPVWIGCLMAYLLLGAVVFYGLVRSGWSTRLADPMMTLPQLIFALSAILASYPVNAASRGLSVLLVGLPPLFGFLAISRRAGLAVLAAIPLTFGPVMLTLAMRDPSHFEPRVEAVHFSVLVVCVLAMAILLGQIISMRNRVRAQKGALAEALRHIEQISTRDDLTGLFNRRHLRVRLEEEVVRRARGGPPFCLCLIDIDHFKRINDGHGHARGDAVLSRFAHILAASLRGSDVLGRWGGEEFLLVLPATDARAALAQVERLRTGIANATAWGADAVLAVRFSAGLADDADATAADILERADRALYSAKAAGRDRVVRADLLPTT